MRSLAEWVLALGVIWLALWLGLPVVRRLAPVPSGTYALVESTLPGLPSGVPSGAQGFPLLILDGGIEVRLGMTEREVRTRPLARLSIGAPLAEPGVLGERAILPFRSGPSRFWVVLDRTEVGREREVTGIYVR
jgi:hypothetical protein